MLATTELGWLSHRRILPSDFETMRPPESSECSSEGEVHRYLQLCFRIQRLYGIGRISVLGVVPLAMSELFYRIVPARYGGHGGERTHHAVSSGLRELLTWLPTGLLGGIGCHRRCNQKNGSLRDSYDDWILLRRIAD